MTSKGNSFRLKGELCAACVRSVMMYGSETWVIKMEDEWRYELNEMRMVRWMCDVSLKDRKSNVELRDRFGIESIREVMCRGRMRWFRHVERMWEASCVKRCINMNVNGRRARGRPRKTWDVLLRDDLRVKGLTRGLARDRAAWKSSH